MREGIDSHWIRSINDKWTFCGAYEELYNDCSKYWRKVGTRVKYDKEYNDIILPNLFGHDNKCIDEYTKEDFDAAIAAIKERGQIRGGTAFRRYSDLTIQHFRHLIIVVVNAAANHGVCDNVLWGSCFSLPENRSADVIIKENIKLKKSLTVSQELDIAKILLTNPEQCGQMLGLLLMFAIGLRNGEACGANYGDIKPMRLHPECKVLWIYKSTIAGTNMLQSSGKTRNADRIIPIPEALGRYIDKRRKCLERRVVFEPNSTVQCIDDLPIACVDDCYFKRCAASRLTAAGRELFRSIKMEEEQLAYIDEELALSNEELKEKDPTAYLFRRNFGTHLSILGLTEAEIEYIIGHDIADAYETRNEFVNEEKLWKIKLKLDQRPILNRSYLQTEAQNIQLLDDPQYREENIPQKYKLPLAPGKLKLHFVTKEPQDALKVTIAVSSQTEFICRQTFSNVQPQPKYERTINILKAYHGAYRKLNKRREDKE